jgi:hypothetical protein
VAGNNSDSLNKIDCFRIVVLLHQIMRKKPKVYRLLFVISIGGLFDGAGGKHRGKGLTLGKSAK